MADPDPARAALVQTVARLKHDLGKYVCFQSRWLAPDASLDEVRAALEADLLATRRGPERVLGASELWAALRRPLVGDEPLPDGSVVDLRGHPQVARIDAAMATVAAVSERLRAGDLDRVAADAGLAAAHAVADACRELVRELRDPDPT